MEPAREPFPGDRHRPHLSPMDFSILAENVSQPSKLSDLSGTYYSSSFNESYIKENSKNIEQFCF